VPAKTTLQFESKMGQDRLPRQLKAQPLHASAISEICDGAGRIDECNVARSELHSLIVLVQGCLASDLIYNGVMVHAIAANVLVGSLDPVSVATEIHCGDPPLDLHGCCREPAYA
jgi:hypothetical protein